MKYNIHKDFRFAVNVPFNETIIRLSYRPMMMLQHFVRPVKNVRVRHERLTLSGGGSIAIDIYEPKISPGTLPCLLYFHGGGFGYEAAPNQIILAGIYAKYARCRVIFPHYHLLPEYTFPAAKNEALECFDMISENLNRLKVDPSRIAVGGDSAGAALAAYVCNERGSDEIPPCFQLLVYPVTNAAMNTESMKRFTDTPLWNSVNNWKMWKMYLCGKTSPLCEYSPLHMKLPKNIPDTYIETAQFDCLRDEGVLYARKLEKHGGNVLLRETKGTVHGYDVNLRSGVSRQSIDCRVRTLKKAFSKIRK